MKPMLAVLGIIHGCSLLILCAALRATTLDLGKTGQTTCYAENGAVIPCAGTGQDGETQTGTGWPTPRFIDNANGTITDQLTGLIWLQQADCFGPTKWLESLAAVNALGDGGCNLTDESDPGDWRLPNILEIVSVSNYGVANPGDWLEIFGFTGFYGVGIWSSTTIIDTLRTNAFTWSSAQGFMGMGAKANTYEVWAVRGISNGPAPVWKTGQTTCYDNSGTAVPCAGTGQDGDHQAGVTWPVPRFADNPDGTVTDNLTGMIWLRNANCYGNRFWGDALADVALLADGDCGLADGSSVGAWRLPNAREIVSLVDYGRTNPALPNGHPFQNVPGSGETRTFWTSNSWAQLPSWGWMDTLAELGQLAFSAKATMYPVWPVRGSVLNPPIFADDFETGDTSAWSSSVP